MILCRSRVFVVVCAITCLAVFSAWRVPPAQADDFSASEFISAHAPKGNGIPLYDAAFAGKAPEVKKLIAAGSNVNETDERRRTPLHGAVFGGSIEAVKLLLLAGSKVDAVNDTRNGGCLISDDGMTGTPLHWAAQTGHLEIARLLIQHGANVNSQQTRWNQTPLHFVGEQGGAGMAALLIQYGVRLNLTGGYDNATPLYYACASGKVETARRPDRERRKRKLRERIRRDASSRGSPSRKPAHR